MYAIQARKSITVDTVPPLLWRWRHIDYLIQEDKSGYDTQDSTNTYPDNNPPGENFAVYPGPDDMHSQLKIRTGNTKKRLSKGNLIRISATDITCDMAFKTQYS